MPFASKAQHRLFRAMEARGELPRGTASRWYHETPHYESLPERVSGFGAYSFGAENAAAEPAAVVQPAAETKPTFWQQHGAEIIVGTITAVTGALAVYFAMRWVGKHGG